MNTPEICPACGHEVPKGRLACPECGADENSGWNEDALLYDGLDLPEEAFEDENNPKEKHSQSPLLSWIWSALALIALIAFVMNLF
ncbi:MAG: zinc-ribbon domain-containing protein [Opitutales bacterium]